MTLCILSTHIASPSGLGADLNKEQWHEDPFADIAQKVKDKAGK